jgi:hypothetical protein
LNKNCRNAYEDLKIRQQWKWKVNVSKQCKSINPEILVQRKIIMHAVLYLPTTSVICGTKAESQSENHANTDE